MLVTVVPNFRRKAGTGSGAEAGSERDKRRRKLNLIFKLLNTNKITTNGNIQLSEIPSVSEVIPVVDCVNSYGSAMPAVPEVITQSKVLVVTTK